MRLLGIDPGLATVGYGVVDVLSGGQLECVSYGCIKTNASLSLSARLQIIYNDMGQLLDRYQPIEVAVEKLFFNTNVTTGIDVSQARGVIMLRIAQFESEIFEYTPLQVKSKVLGYGRAEKKQVQYMVQNVLKLKKRPRPDDAADGLALAICHYYSCARRMKENVTASRK